MGKKKSKEKKLPFVFYLGLAFIIGLVIYGNSPGVNLQSSPVGLDSLSDNVESYENLIKDELDKNSLLPTEEYLPWILAQMDQESKGKGKDPMQCSESKYGYIGGIKSPEDSISHGVKIWTEIKSLCQELGIKDNEATILQAYNYGSGYIYWLSDQGYSEYSKENSLEFSLEKSYGLGKEFKAVNKENTNARYGDFLYAEKVTQKRALLIEELAAKKIQL